VEALNEHPFTKSHEQVYVLISIQFDSQLSRARRDCYRILEMTKKAQIVRRTEHASSLRLDHSFPPGCRALESGARQRVTPQLSSAAQYNPQALLTG
jgi:hypothetical protein